MFRPKTYRLKTALILMMTILVPILILSYNAYSIVTESRIKSQEKLIIDRLSTGVSNFDTWFTDRLSRLMLLNQSEDRVNDTATSLESRVRTMGEESVQAIATTAQGRFHTFMYLKQPCFVLLSEDGRTISLGVGDRKRFRYMILDIPRKIFEEHLAKTAFMHPIGQFFVVDGQVVLSTAKISRKDLNFFGSEQNAFIKREQLSGIQALFYEESPNGRYGVGAVENYSEYLVNYQVLTNRFWAYTVMLAIFSICAILLIATRMGLPVKKLKTAVGQILSGNLEATIKVHPYDDFSDLYNHFNHMVGLNYGQINGLKKKLEESKYQNSEMVSLNNQLEQMLVQLEGVNSNLSYADQKIMVLLDHVADLIFRMNKDGKITYINEAFVRELGLREDDCLQKEVSEILCIEEEDSSRLSVESFLAGELRDVVVHFFKEDGNLSESYSMNTQRVYEEGQVTAVQAICRELKSVNLIQDKLNRRNRELEFLREINETLSSTADLPGLLSVITTKIDHLIGTAICTIRMLNESGGLTLKSVSGQYRHLVRKSDIEAHVDPSGVALAERRIIVMREKEHLEFQFGEELSQLMPRIKELVFIPLENEGRQMGVISIGLNRKVTEYDIQILDNFAYQAAIAIDKASLYDKLKLEYLNTIKALATAVEAKDEYTEGHSIRVSKFSCLIAEYMGIREESLDEIEIAGLLHDIGKIGIGDAILTKPGKLTDEEFNEIKRHPDIGYKIVEPIGLSQTIVDGILYHHKRMDMTGYPEQVVLGEVPISARIIGVADAFDAMTSNRSYTRKKDIYVAMDELKRCKGTQFCPIVVEAFDKIMMSSPERIEVIVQGS